MGSFNDKLLAGERDFEKIKLTEEFNLTKEERYKEVLKYLRKEKLSFGNRIDMANSDLMGLNSKGLYFPYLFGVDTIFKEGEF